MTGSGSVTRQRNMVHHLPTAKKFRYGTDILSRAFPVGTFDKVDAKFKKLQDLLGEINDRVVAVERLKDRQSGKGAKSRKNRELLSQELKRLRNARDKFSRFWRPQLVAEFRSTFGPT